MKVKSPDYYKEFKCKAGKCLQSCCKAGWEIVVDENTLNFYQNCNGQFADKLKTNIRKNGDEFIFCTSETVCNFMTEDGLCEIQNEYGEKHLCRTCGLYPRYTYEYGSLCEQGLELSCEEAARLIIEHKDKIFFSSEKNDNPPSPNEINAELFKYVISSRERIFGIIQDDRKNIKDIISNLLLYGDALQKSIKKGTYTLPSNFSNKTVSLKYKANYLKHLEILTEQWQSFAKGKKANQIVLLDYQKQFENLLIYFIYRYYMNAVYDGDVLTKIKFAVFSCETISSAIATYGDLTGSAIAYSREIEHSEENMNRLSRKLKKTKIIANR